MNLKTLVTFHDNKEYQEIEIDGEKILDTLGKSKSEAIAVQLKDLLTSITDEVNASLKQQGELTIEISGSLDIKTAANIKYLFFNAGADVKREKVMKIILKTTILPNNE